MTDIATHYHTLEVDEIATPDALKKAYRRLARANHPDRNPGDASAEERFKAIQEAYETLSDPEKRRAYDRARRDPFSSSNGGGAGPWRSPFEGGAGASGFSASGFSDAEQGFDPLFSFFFSEASSARQTPPAGDLETEVLLTFDQALRGGTTEVHLPDHGAIRLAIPQGARSGLKVRVRGRGAVGPSSRGDLYVTFRVEPNTRFRREGDHLHLAETVSAVEAMLGTTRSITNAYGQAIKVHIPPGTQPGERLRLRGQGVATSKRTGDLFVEVRVVVPRGLSDAQREELAATARRLGLL